VKKVTCLEEKQVREDFIVLNSYDIYGELV
jgi:hypothetical protein